MPSFPATAAGDFPSESSCWCAVASSVSRQVLRSTIRRQDTNFNGAGPMGPRSGERGTMPLSPGPAGASAASMEPRSSERGKSAPARCWAEISARLQWSRVPVNAERSVSSTLRPKTLRLQWSRVPVNAERGPAQVVYPPGSEKGLSRDGPKSRTAPCRHADPASITTGLPKSSHGHGAFATAPPLATQLSPAVILLDSTCSVFVWSVEIDRNPFPPPVLRGTV